MLGISPDFVAAANWGLGSGLAVVAAILIVNVSGLNVTNLALLVVPGMAAALVGSFRSFWLTLAGGLLIGVLESEVAVLQTKVSDPAALQGWGRAVPFLVIIVVLMVRGRALPLRSEAAERPPEVGTGRVRPAIVLPLAAAGIAIIAFGLPTNGVEEAMTTATTAIVGALARRRHRIRRAALARGSLRWRAPACGSPPDSSSTTTFRSSSPRSSGSRAPCPSGCSSGYPRCDREE